MKNILAVVFFNFRKIYKFLLLTDKWKIKIPLQI